MAVFKRVTAGYMLLVGAAVAVHFLANQLYDPTVEGASRTVWAILNPLMIVALVAALAIAFERKRRLNGAPGQPVDREYLEANGTFYYGAALLLALLWNWLGTTLDPRNEDGWIWTMVDTTLPLLLAANALHLLRQARTE